MSLGCRDLLSTAAVSTALDLNVCPGGGVGASSEVEGGVRWKQDQDGNLISLAVSKEGFLLHQARF
jgi:hypothetical protein